MMRDVVRRRLGFAGHGLGENVLVMEGRRNKIGEILIIVIPAGREVGVNTMNERNGGIVADFETFFDKLVEFLVDLPRFFRGVDSVEEVLVEGTGNRGWLRQMVVTHVEKNAGRNPPDFAHAFFGEEEAVALEDVFCTDVVERDVLGADEDVIFVAVLGHLNGIEQNIVF